MSGERVDAMTEALRSHYLDPGVTGDMAENCHCGLRTTSRYARARHLAEIASAAAPASPTEPGGEAP